MSLTYQVRVGSFSGPLDLLLQLIEQRALDITTLALAEITDQYLTVLASLDEPDPTALAHFIRIAARLLLLKSRALLPTLAPAGPEGPEAAEGLVERLRAYRPFRLAALALRERQEAGWRLYRRLDRPLPAAAPVRPLGTGAMLAHAYQRALARRRPLPTAPLPIRPVLSLTERIALIQQALQRRPVWSLRDLMGAPTRAEAVVTLLAVLELIKQGQVHAHQADPGQEIIVTARAEHPEKGETADASADHHDATARLGA